MDLTNIEDLRLAMRLAGLNAKKSLGQHFLIDRDSLEAVMAAAELTADDTVLEVGPGFGVMTLPLCRAVKQVVAVEADSHLAELLERDKPDNLTVANQDILRFDLTAIKGDYKVVANIPYYLTSQLLRLFMEAPHRPKRLSLLIQKEVAERVVAEPGKMSTLALSVQYYGRPSLAGVVERHKFWPAPKVDSAILRIDVTDQPAFPADTGKLFRLIKAGFGEKRKMLKNSLAGGLNISIELAAQLLTQAGIGGSARAQELSLDEWKHLYRATVSAEVL